jgi:hypothetical protein
MDEDEVSSQDESIPQQLRQSSMELKRTESEPSSRDITNGLDEFPTHPRTIAQSTQMLAGVTEEKNKPSNKVKRKKSEEEIRRAYVEGDSEDEYLLRSLEKEISRYKIKEDIQIREEVARILERERERAARAAEREATRETKRAAIERDLPPKWDAHAEYAGQYMQAARRKAVPDQFSYPDM